MPARQPAGAATLLSFGAASRISYLAAGATVSLAEQDTVEPQVSKGRCWGEQAKLVGPQHTSCRLIFCNSRQLARLRFALLPFTAISDL